jgi:hypothetical protein
MPMKAVIRDGKIAGYQCQQAAMESLKPGDKTGFVIPAQPKAVRLWDDLRTAAIASVERDGDLLRIALNPPVALSKSQRITKLAFRLNAGWYRLEKAE